MSASRRSFHQVRTMPEKPPHNKPGGSRGSETGTVTYLDSTLWRQLLAADSDEEFYSVWLALQARMIEGVYAGIVVLGSPDTGPFAPVALWPRGSTSPGNLVGIAEKILQEKKGVVSRSEASGEGASPDKVNINVGYPIRVEGRVHGTAAFEISPRAQDELQTVMRQVQWGLAWVENWILRRNLHGGSRIQERVTAALDLAAVALQEEKFKAAASSLVTQIASRLGCDRVSLGFSRRKHVRIHALSHTAQFKKQMNLVRAIGTAMTESIDQAAPLIYPDGDGTSQHVLRAHAELSSQQGDASICTVPFLDGAGRGYGALTMERSADRPFDQYDADLFDAVAALAGPILEEKRKNDRWLIFKAGDSFRAMAGKVLGRGHLVAKLVTAAILLVVLFFTFAEGNYRITAKTIIEGSIQRAVVAPYDGFIHEAHVRAGDTVVEGQVLCSLDDRDMRLERLRWESQREQFLRQYREAMAEGNRANVKILREQISQAEAQMALLDEQLTRARMAAPFAGIVVTGDLSQSLGSPVQRGQVLFEVAPLEKYRLKMRVDEREIEQVQVGQKGVLILNSLPEEPMTLTVQKMTPVSAAEEGKNFFIVEAGLEEVSDRLRPGMEGFGKISVDRRKLIWIWTHELIDWVKLWVWSWWP